MTSDIPTEAYATRDRGDAGSWIDDVYLRVVPLMRRIATRKFSVPSQDADALIHDVFITYLSNPAHVRELRPYLVAGICNASRQYWRRETSKARVFVSSNLAECVGDPPTDVVIDRLTLAKLLSSLNPRCRDVLRRYYLDGESAASIAAALQTTVGYVSQLLHQCRRRAREMYRATSDQ